MTVRPTKHFLFDKVLTTPPLSRSLDAISLNIDFQTKAQGLWKWRVYAFHVFYGAEINNRWSLRCKDSFFMIKILIVLLVFKRAFFEFQIAKKRSF